MTVVAVTQIEVRVKMNDADLLSFSCLCESLVERDRDGVIAAEEQMELVMAHQRERFFLDSREALLPRAAHVHIAEIIDDRLGVQNVPVVGCAGHIDGAELAELRRSFCRPCFLTCSPIKRNAKYQNLGILRIICIDI